MVDPESARNWFSKGVALDELERYGEAIKCYDKLALVTCVHEKSQ